MTHQDNLEHYEATEVQDLTRFLYALRPSERAVQVPPLVDLTVRAAIWQVPVQRQVITLLSLARRDLVQVIRQALTDNPLLEEVARAEDEHTPAGELASRAIVLRVHQSAFELAGPWPVREPADVVTARRDDDDARPQLLAVRLHDPVTVVAADALYEPPSTDIQSEAVRIRRQIAGVLILRDVTRERAGQRVVGEAREAAHRVQMQAVIAALPRAADGLVALQQNRPAHSGFWIRGLDSVLRHIEVSAFPLIGQSDRYLGAVALFLEAPA